jgi:hypothetical protein
MKSNLTEQVQPECGHKFRKIEDYLIFQTDTEKEV